MAEFFYFCNVRNDDCTYKGSVDYPKIINCMWRNLLGYFVIGEGTLERLFKKLRTKHV